MSMFQESPQEKAFHKLSVIANEMKDVLGREYNIAVITDADGIDKLCFLGKKLTTNLVGGRVHSRKRYVLPLNEVTSRMTDFSLENGYKWEPLREANDCLNVILERKVGPFLVRQSRFGFETAYRLLCQIAEDRLSH